MAKSRRTIRELVKLWVGRMRMAHLPTRSVEPVGGSAGARVAAVGAGAVKVTGLAGMATVGAGDGAVAVIKLAEVAGLTDGVVDIGMAEMTKLKRAPARCWMAELEQDAAAKMELVAMIRWPN